MTEQQTPASVVEAMALVREVRDRMRANAADTLKHIGPDAEKLVGMMYARADALDALLRLSAEREELREALERARLFVDACATEGELTPNETAENPCEVVNAIDAALAAEGRCGPIRGHDRHLVEVGFPNGMRLTVVREDDYDAVTVWSEDGESIFTQAEVFPRLAALTQGESRQTGETPEAVALSDMREIAVRLGYPSILEALEDLDRLKSGWQDIATLTQTGFATPLVDVWAIGPDEGGPDAQYRIADCWRRNDGAWFSSRFGELKQSRVTHWMPLPAAPTPADGDKK